MQLIKYFGEEALSTFIELTRQDLADKLGKDDLSALTNAEILALLDGLDADTLETFLDQYYTKAEVNTMVNAAVGRSELEEITVDELNALWTK